MIQSAIAKLVEKEDLTYDEASRAVSQILEGQATPVQITGFLTALRMKGETAEEIAGCAHAMRGAATRIHLDAPAVIVDTCGTGGDKRGSFNISTAAAFVVAGAGFTVAKHGNRSISSQCGSADVLEALGVKVDPPSYVVERCLHEIGIGFLFAPAFHPAMKHAMSIRRELGFRTVFNVLGPLCNPAGANAQVIGVFSEKLMPLLARVLVRLGAKHSMLVHCDGHDEIVLSRSCTATEIVNGKIRKLRLSPSSFGFKKAVPAQALKGGNKEENAAIIRRIFDGEKGPRRDVVIANAAAAILVACRVLGRKEVKDLKSAKALAEDSIDSGAAKEKLERLAQMTHEVISP